MYYTWSSLVIIVLIIEILRQPLPVVSQSTVPCLPLGPSGESHFINLSYLECIFYNPPCGCKKWQGTFKSKINCFSIQIIVFCVWQDRNTNTQGMRSQETHIATSPYLTFFLVFFRKIHILQFSGGDDVQQLCEAGEEEFLEIMMLVDMASKPLHVRRLQKALQEWVQNPGELSRFCIKDNIGSSVLFQKRQSVQWHTMEH